MLEILDADRAALLRDARRILRNHEDAEDAVQDALFSAWRGAANFEGRASSRTYLRTCVRNQAIQVLRNRARHGAVYSIEGTNIKPRARGPGIEREIDARTLYARCVAKSERRNGALIPLLAGGDLTYAEIGTALGMSEAWVKTRVFRLRARLRHVVPELAAVV